MNNGNYPFGKRNYGPPPSLTARTHLVRALGLFIWIIRVVVESL